MLSLKIISKDKTELECTPLTVVYDSEEGVPADSITATFIYDPEYIKSADYLCAYIDGGLVFKGQLDSIVNIKQADKVITRLSARSPAAALLDNEAEPLTYINPAAKMIAKRHLEPFGVRLETNDNIPIEGALRIDKGMSHWQVFESFCKKRYGKAPAVNGMGTARIGLENSSDEVVFYGSQLLSLRQTLKRSEIISEVRVKINEKKGYTSTVRNESDECSGITRVRYLNAAADNISFYAAENAIAEGNRECLLFTLEIPMCLVGKAGHKARIEDSDFGRADNLVIKKTRYTLSADGEKTAVTLVKEK